MIMTTNKQSREMIDELQDGQNVCFKVFDSVGAICYKCNGRYLLFEVTFQGGEQSYWGTYSNSEIDDLIEQAESFK